MHATTTNSSKSAVPCHRQAMPMRANIANSNRSGSPCRPEEMPMCANTINSSTSGFPNGIFYVKTKGITSTMRANTTNISKRHMCMRNTYILRMGMACARACAWHSCNEAGSIAARFCQSLVYPANTKLQPKLTTPELACGRMIILACGRRIILACGRRIIGSYRPVCLQPARTDHGLRP
jgi:hypothetical protein